VVALAAGRSRTAAAAAAGLLAGGALATRFGVFRAGVASAADPKYVVASQRAAPGEPAAKMVPAGGRPAAGPSGRD
jgi:hypothetical protein